MITQSNKRADRLSLVIIPVYCLLMMLFPTVRVLIIGSGESTTSMQYLISAFPDLISVGVIAWFLGRHFFLNKLFSVNTFDWLFIGYIFINVCWGAIQGGDFKLAVYGFRQTYLPMFFYFIGRCFENRNELAEKILHRIFFTFVFLGAAGLTLYFLFPEFDKFMTMRVTGFIGEYVIRRMGSLFYTAVAFGAFMAAGVLYFFYRQCVMQSWINLLFMSVCWCGLVLSVSRGSLAIAAIGFIWISVWNRNWKLIFICAAILLIEMIVLIFLLTGSLNLFSWLFSSALDTISLGEHVTRVELWSRSWNSFTVSPLGYGLGKSGYVAHRFLLHSPVPSSPWSTDCWYLKLAGETGVTGLLSYLGLLVSFVILQLRKLSFNSRIDSTFILWFVLFGIQNIMSNVLDFYLLSSLYWFCFGLAIKKAGKA